MAKGSKGADNSGSRSHSKDAKIADIRTGSKTLADAADFSHGYPETMQHHINRGGGKKAK